MTTYNTRNPIGSKDPKDLYDNAENLDTAVNDTSRDTWPDRLGRSRKTMSGMEREFNTDQASRDNRFNTFIASSGYQFLGDYAAGIEITEYNQIVRDADGEFWRLSGQVELPYTTTGDWGAEEGQFVVVGDAALRQELADPDKGALMVRGAVAYVNTIADLQAMDTSGLADGQQVAVRGLREFTWSAADSRFDVSYDLFVVYGQSNAVGYAGGTDGYPANISDELCLFWNYPYTVLEPIRSNMRYASGETSSGHAWAAFANRYFDATGRGVIIVPCAFGGTEISELKKGTEKYTSMVDAITSLDSYLSASDLVVESRSVLWMQGESDQSGDTTRGDYQLALDDLIRDMQADFTVDKFFISLVGNPQSRTEESWLRIQSAQEYISQSYDWVVMAYTGFASFTVSNGMLRDGVHATQQGYNRMGEAMAESAAYTLNYNAPTSPEALDRYGVVTVPGDQIWRHVYCRIQFDEASGLWTLRNRDEGDYRIANVDAVVMLPDRIRIFLCSRASIYLGISATANAAAVSDGLKATAEFAGYVGLAGGSAGSGYAIDIYLNQDISFYVNGSGDITRSPDASSNLPAYLASVSAVVEDDSSITISHPATTHHRIVNHISNNDFSGMGNIGIGLGLTGIDAATKTRIRIEDGARQVAAVTIPCAKLPPEFSRNGWEIDVSALVAEARY